MSTVVSSVKIDEVLKGKLRHYAEVHSENLSVATEELLLITFTTAEETGISAEDIDSQHMEESVVGALTPKEIKVLRRPLRKKK